MGKWLKLILITAIVLTTFCYILLYYIEKRNFSGVALAPDYKFHFSLPYTESSLFYKGKNISLVHFYAKKSKGVIYFLHGGGGNLNGSDRIAELFVENGYDVVAIDYPGYGKTTVTSDSNSWYPVVQAGYNHLKTRYREKDIIIYGRSLGCALAAQLASKNSPGKLILGSPVYERGGLATQLPDPLAWVFKTIYPSAIQYEFSTRSYIAEVHCPVIIFCGAENGDCTDSKKLLQMANPNKLSIITIPDADHVSILDKPAYKCKLLNSIQDNH